MGRYCVAHLLNLTATIKSERNSSTSLKNRVEILNKDMEISNNRLENEIAYRTRMVLDSTAKKIEQNAFSTNGTKKSWIGICKRKIWSIHQSTFVIDFLYILGLLSVLVAVCIIYTN